jgi:hypothetical protein
LYRHEWVRLEKMQLSERAIGDVCRTFRGLPAQRRLAAAGAIPVLAGRDLERWRLRSYAGFLPAGQGAYDLSRFQKNKLVFQNIIAHVANPRPHLRLIGAFDGGCTATLDTVNNLVARDAGVDLYAILALLHSRLINWFVYAVVYNKAIRTMHFDQYFLNKIPLPADFDGVQRELGKLGRICTEQAAEMANSVGASPGRGERILKLGRQHNQTCAELDQLVDVAYRVSP